MREYARLTTEPVSTSLDCAQVSVSAFDHLCTLNESVARGGATLLQVEGRRWLKLDNYVGVVQTPCGTQLEILPKHVEAEDCVRKSRALLCKLIASALELPTREAGVADLEKFDVPLTEWVMARFIDALERLTKRGVRFDYQRVEEEQRFMRGQLNVVAQMRQPPGRQHFFHIRHDIFSPDRAENRLLKCAVARVLAATHNAESWRLANELCVLLKDVPECRDVAADFRVWRIDRNMAHYQGVKPWCQLVLGDAMPLAVSGESNGMCLLFPMERLFENYVAGWLRRQLMQDAKLKAQARFMSLCMHNGSSMFQLRPDILVQQGGGTWVMDTKWKRIDRSVPSKKYGLSEGDFYQMFAYGHTYRAGAGQLALIYPRWSSFTEPLVAFSMATRKEGNHGQELRLWVLPFNLDDETEGLVVPQDAHFPFLRTTWPG
ncbi:McrC family protein [Variovorax paradoxus]|nr:McrC family protein [Variovorax paradoxus]